MGFFFLWGINKHREPLDPRRPANARRFRPAERFDKAVIVPPRQHGPLRAKAVGYKLKSRVAIVIQAAPQSRLAGPYDARSIQHDRIPIGRASCREGQCRTVVNWVVAGYLQRYNTKPDNEIH